MTPIEALENDIDPQEIIDQTPPAPPPLPAPVRIPADFVKALGQLSEPAKSGKVNAGQRRYTYLTLPDLLDAVRTVFAAHNLAFTQAVYRDGDLAVCTTTVWHTSGWSYTTEPLVNRCSPGIQDLGSASTYLRRYSLAALVGLAGADDDDGAAAQRNAPAKATGAHAPKGTNTTEAEPSLPPVDPETGEILDQPAKPKRPITRPTDPISKPQLGMIHALLKEAQITDRDEALQMMASFARLEELKSSKDLTIAQGSMVIAELQALTKGQADA